MQDPFDVLLLHALRNGSVDRILIVATSKEMNIVIEMRHQTARNEKRLGKHSHRSIFAAVAHMVHFVKRLTFGTFTWGKNPSQARRKEEIEAGLPAIAFQLLQVSYSVEPCAHAEDERK